MRPTTVSDEGLALLKRLEGCRLDSYPDEAGVWTIGYGHTGPEVVAGLSWTQEQVDVALRVDVNRFAAGVADLVEPELPQARFDALVIFAYNVGSAAFRASTALARVNRGELDGVTEAMARFRKVRDPASGALVVSDGLVKRRRAEAAIWDSAPGAGAA